MKGPFMPVVSAPARSASLAMISGMLDSGPHLREETSFGSLCSIMRAGSAGNSYELSIRYDT
jgi:hypothetical protein